MVRCLVRAYGYAANGVQKLNAVDVQHVRVVLRDDVAILRIFAYEKAADDNGLAE